MRVKKNYLYCLLLLFFSVNFFARTEAQVPGYVPTDSLVAWYPFNGNANDVSGNNNNGTAHGASFLTADRYSNPNSACYFDGDDFISGSCDGFPTASRTISVWFSLDNNSNHHVLFGYGGDPSCGKSYISTINISGSGLMYVISHCNGPGAFTSNGYPPVNTWNNLVISSDNSETKFYMNGGLVDTKPANFYGTVVKGKQFAFGVAVDGLGFAPLLNNNDVGFLKGKLDDIGIWNRVLSPQEINRLYHGNQALHLDGINDFAAVPDNAALDFTDSLTIEAWIEPGDVAGYHNIAGKSWCSQGAYGYNFYIVDGKIYFDWSASGSCNVVSYYSTNSPVVTNLECTHVAVVFSRSEVKIYVNGALVPGSLILGNYSQIHNSNSPFRIGTYRDLNGTFANFFNGEIDELRLWNRKLSISEINARMNSPLAGNEPGLVAYYDMEESGTGNGFTIFNKCIATGSSLNATSVGSTNSPYHAGGCNLSGNLHTYYLDADTDGYGNPSIVTIASVQPAGHVLENSDCNDNKANIHPGALEICGNGIDEDCNGSDGICGASLNFDGENDYVNIPNNANLNANIISLEAWVNLNNTNGTKTIISKFGDVASDDSYILRVDNGHAHFQLNFGTWTAIESKSILASSTWYHIAGVYDGTAMKIYVNGNLENSIPQTGTIRPSVSSLKIGRPGLAIPLGQDIFSGRIDEVRIWNLARTQLEIQSAMNCEITTPQPGLLLNYHFNQGVAAGNNTTPPINTLIDASRNNNTGTLNNFTLNGNTSNWITPSAFASGITCYLTYYRDADKDGFGNPLIDSISLTPPAGFILNNTDCNDTNSNIHPGVIEICDSIDNNCDGVIDNITGTPNVAGNTNLCLGTTLSLTASGGNTYQWTGPNGFTRSTATITRSNISLADSGNYIVTIGYTGCQQTSVITKHVFVIAPPVAAITGLSSAYCLGDSISILTGIPSGGIFSGTGISGNTFNPNFTGTDTVSYISPPYYGCPADIAIQITQVNNIPSVSITNSGSLFLCAGDTITLTANTTANRFLWNTGDTSSVIRISKAGIYKVTATNAAGCSKESAPVQISNDSILHISSNKGSVICDKDTLQLAFTGSNVLWSTGATSQVISPVPSASTIYSVQGTSVHGCIYRDSIAITVNPNQPPGAVSNMFPPSGSVNLSYPLNFSWLPGIYNGALDFYLWDSAQAQPANPYTANIYGIGTTVTDGLNYGSAYKWRIVSKNGSCASTSGTVQTFTLRNLPDLIPQNIKTPLATVVGGQTISVGWQIKNNGTGGTGSATWIDNIYLSANDTTLQDDDIFVASHLNFSALDSGQAYNDSISITLPLTRVGTFYLIVKTDAYNHIPESNQTNNAKPSANPINVILPPLPDLRVTAVASQTNVFSGTNCIVTYTIKNFGNAATNLNSRTDHIYFSPISILDTSGMKVAGNFSESFVLAPGQSKTITVTANVPRHISGTYFVHVFTDALKEIFEGPNENNNSNKDSINVFLSGPPDLSVYGLEMNDIIQSGENVQIKYGLKNNGLGRTDSVWFDGIFLSGDTIFNLATAIPLKWIFHTNVPFDTVVIDRTNLILCPPNVQNCRYQYIFYVYVGSYFISLDANEVKIVRGGLSQGDSINLPFAGKLSDTLSGNYNVFVVTDIGNTVFEYDKENNNIFRRGKAVTFLNPDPSVTSVNAPENAAAGATATISWEVKNNGPGNLVKKIRKDAIYLSSSPVLNLDTAIFLGDLEYSTALLKNEVIQLQKVVTLPAYVSGPWYVFVRTDYANNIFENGLEENNIAHSSAMQIRLTSWADLAPISINVPDTIKTTIDYTITSTVANNGSLHANGSWADAFYISKSPVWNSLEATLIHTSGHSGNIAAGGNYANNDTIRLPLTTGIINGSDSAWYYIYYKADNNNQVFENTADSNNVFRSDSVFVYNPWVDHIVTAVTGNDIAFSGQPYAVQWTVKNIGEKIGASYYKEWFDGLYRSVDTAFDASDTIMWSTSQNTFLNHDEAYSRNTNFYLPPGVSGDYYLIARTDWKNEISGEINKNNNHNLIRNANGTPKIIQFVTPPPSDLAPTILTAPNTGIAGQPLTIIYKVTNNGPADANPTTSWIDQLSLSPGYYPGQTVLQNNNHAKGLKIDSSYTDTARVFLPINASGNYVLVLKTDATNKIYEAGQENNNNAYSTISVIQLPPCDLVAANIIAPDSALSGSTATISWQLKNMGVNPAYGVMREAVYFSKDTIWDNDDQLVGTVTNSINLVTDSSITHNLTANLNGAFGNNHILVRVDLLNNIYEINENNNVTASDGIYISIKNLPIEISTPDSLSNTNLLNYRIDIPAALRGETLMVSVVGDTTNGNTELYASFNRIPSTVSYQYADNNPYHKIKKIVIPSLDSGTYYLTIKGRVNNAASQPVSLLAHILPFEITKVETNRGGNTGNVTVKIDGSKFEPGMTVKLKPNNAGTDIVATNVIFVNSTFIWATFNLAQKPLGVYDVSLRKTNNLETLLNNGFTIEQGNNGTFTVNGTGMTGTPGTPGCNPCATGSSDESIQLVINHPFQERVFRNVPITILFANAGNVDITIPSRLLVSDYFPVSWENTLFNNSPTELLIEFRELNGPPGILRAGASGSVTFFTRIIATGENKYILK
jgi:subtilase family serine protease